MKKQAHTHSTPQMCAKCVMVDITAPCHTVVWAQLLYVQENSVDRERVTVPRYSLGINTHEPSDTGPRYSLVSYTHEPSDTGPRYSLVSYTHEPSDTGPRYSLVSYTHEPSDTGPRYSLGINTHEPSGTGPRYSLGINTHEPSDTGPRYSLVSYTHEPSDTGPRYSLVSYTHEPSDTGPRYSLSSYTREPSDIWHAQESSCRSKLLIHSYKCMFIHIYFQTKNIAPFKHDEVKRTSSQRLIYMNILIYFLNTWLHVFVRFKFTIFTVGQKVYAAFFHISCLSERPRTTFKIS